MSEEKCPFAEDHRYRLIKAIRDNVQELSAHVGTLALVKQEHNDLFSASVELHDLVLQVGVEIKNVFGFDEVVRH